MFRWYSGTEFRARAVRFLETRRGVEGAFVSGWYLGAVVVCVLTASVVILLNVRVLGHRKWGFDLVR